jgi:hypothetical protein
MRTDPHPLRRRPLAGCRLSRETVQAVLPVGWPWSPSLPAATLRLGPAFAGLPVLRNHPTPLVPLPCRPFVLHSYRRDFRDGGREVSPGKNAESRADAVAFTHAARRILGFTAIGQLTPRTYASRRFTSVRFGTAPRASTTRSLAGPRRRLSSSPRRPVLRSAHLPCQCEVPSVRVLEGFRLARVEHRWYLPFRARAGRTENLATLGFRS